MIAALVNDSLHCVALIDGHFGGAAVREMDGDHSFEGLHEAAITLVDDDRREGNASASHRLMPSSLGVIIRPNRLTRSSWDWIRMIGITSLGVILLVTMISNLSSDVRDRKIAKHWVMLKCEMM